MGPGDGEAVGPDVEGGHECDVFIDVVVVVAGRTAIGGANGGTWLATKDIPHGGSLAVFIDERQYPLDLVTQHGNPTKQSPGQSRSRAADTSLRHHRGGCYGCRNQDHQACCVIMAEARSATSGLLLLLLPVIAS